jgi:hypothetical protein
MLYGLFSFMKAKKAVACQFSFELAHCLDLNLPVHSETYSHKIVSFLADLKVKIQKLLFDQRPHTPHSRPLNPKNL